MSFVKASYNYIPAGPRAEAPPAPKGGTRAHGTPKPPPDWRALALCKDQSLKHGSVWLYPELHITETVKAALAMCAVCPVVNECDRMPQPRVGIVAGAVWVLDNHGRATRQKPRFCKKCKAEFFGATAQTKYCSNACRGGARLAPQFGNVVPIRVVPTKADTRSTVLTAHKRSDVTGGPLVDIVRHLPTPVKFGRGS